MYVDSKNNYNTYTDNNIQLSKSRRGDIHAVGQQTHDVARKTYALARKMYALAREMGTYTALKRNTVETHSVKTPCSVTT